MDCLSSYLFNICRLLEKKQNINTICTTINFRNKINIDENTCGNCIITMPIIDINLDNILNLESIINTSKNIRKSINLVNKELIDKHGINIEYYRRNNLFEKYIFNLHNNYFLTNSWTSFKFKEFDFNLNIIKFTPPSIPLPYFTLYIDSNKEIEINIMLPKNIKYSFIKIINNDINKEFRNY